MDGFLGELGKRLAERWFTLLVLPGALYLAICATANALGQAHALEPGRLARRVTAWSKTPGGTTGGQILILAAILVGAAAAGFVAQAVGRLAERLVLAADWTGWPYPLYLLASRLVDRRRRRWDAASSEYQQRREQARQARAHGDREDPAERDRAYRALNRIAEARPQRPTWSGDRIHAVGRRLHDDLGIDTARSWPALWLVLPDTSRAEITTARTDLAGAATLAGWAALYLPIAVWWWPAAPVALVLAIASAHRFRTAADTYARLIEASARLNIVALAEKLKIPADGPATVETGRAITSQLGPHG
ncbi:MAG: hypothetical protein HOV87_03550 [Catenulispora sp.]|nr:hypothetical protein [Catenulispora sp.]